MDVCFRREEYIEEDSKDNDREPNNFIKERGRVQEVNADNNSN